MVVNYASSREGAEHVVASIRAKGGLAIAVQADVAKADDVERLFAEAKAAYGRFDVLVNNAGVYNFLPIEAVTVQEFQRQFWTNVLGPLQTIQASLRHFGEEGGSVVNVSSITSVNPQPSMVLYSATKSALDSITRSLAIELGPRKIRVNAVSPGLTETEGVHSMGVIGSGHDEASAGQTPLGRIGQPDEVAAVIPFLASDASRWVTGEYIRASGGYK